MANIDYQAFKTSLAAKESGRNMSTTAKNPNSSAKGRYQFTDEWNDKLESMGSTKPSETLGDESAQEDQFKTYFDKSIVEDVKALRKADTKNKFSDPELGAMAHFVGRSAALNYIKTGKEPEATKPGNKGKNPTLAEYITDWSSKYESQRMAPSPSPTPSTSSRKLTDTVASPSREPTPQPSPTRAPKIDEAIDRGLSLTQEDEPDNTLQRRLAAEERQPASAPEFAYTPPKSEKEEFIEKDQEFLQNLYKKYGVEQGAEIEPREFAESTEDFVDRLDTMTKDVYSSEFSEEDKKEFSDAVEGFEKSRDAVIKAYEEGVRRTEIAEVVELLGQAVAQIAAGWYGLKHGIDMSGVKFKPRDWSGNYSRLAKRLETGLGEIDRKERTTRSEFKEKESQARRAAEDVERRETRAYYTDKSDFESRESRRVSQFNRQLGETRRNLANSVVEYNRNLNRAVQEAKTADNKQRQQQVNALNKQLQMQEKDLKQIEEAQKNFKKAYEAKDMDKMESALLSIPGYTQEMAEELSGRGMFNLQERDEVLKLFLQARKAAEVQRGLAQQTRQNIMNLQGGGPLQQQSPAQMTPEQKQKRLEEIAKRKAELLGGGN